MINNLIKLTIVNYIQQHTSFSFVFLKKKYQVLQVTLPKGVRNYSHSLVTLLFKTPGGNNFFTFFSLGAIVTRCFRRDYVPILQCPQERGSADLA